MSEPVWKYSFKRDIFSKGLFRKDIKKYIDKGTKALYGKKWSKFVKTIFPKK